MLLIENLSKSFGSFEAVHNISLNVEAGDFFGFLGPNGAGKTTTIKMITGLYFPASGKVSINGIDIVKSPIEAKKIIGYIPDQPFLYDKLTGREFLFFSGGLYNLDKKYLINKIEEVIDDLKIEPWVDKRTEEYSQGMRQRIAIASSLLHSPKLIVVDEPMVGLDPQSANLVKKVLKKKTEEGASVFMSTHSLSVAEEICTRIGIIKNGNIIFDDKMEALEKFKKENNKTLEEFFLELTNE